MEVKAKMLCTVADKNEAGHIAVRFMAVTGESPEDNTYAQATPAGDMYLYVNNENVIEFFKAGEKFFVTITKA